MELNPLYLLGLHFAAWFVVVMLANDVRRWSTIRCLGAGVGIYILGFATTLAELTIRQLGA